MDETNQIFWSCDNYNDFFLKYLKKIIKKQGFC